MAKEKVTTTENPFGEGYKESQAGDFIKWEIVGQNAKGILIDKYEGKDPNGNPQQVYVLEDESGTEFRVSSRGKIFDASMKKVVFGQWVGFLFHSEIPPKQKGFSAFKLIKVYPGQIDENYNKEKSGDTEINFDE